MTLLRVIQQARRVMHGLTVRPFPHVVTVRVLGMHPVHHEHPFGGVGAGELVGEVFRDGVFEVSFRGVTHPAFLAASVSTFLSARLFTCSRSRSRFAASAASRMLR